MNRGAEDRRFSLFPVMCSQLRPGNSNPPGDNSNLFLFPLMVRVIGSPLYLEDYNKEVLFILKMSSFCQYFELKTVKRATSIQAVFLLALIVHISEI